MSENGWQVVVPESAGLSGRRLAEITGWLVGETGANWVAVSGVDGAGPSVEGLMKLDSSTFVCSAKEFLLLAGGVSQFDWGDFFLCAGREAANSISADEDYAQSVAKAIVTVRAVDDEDFFVYGTGDGLLRAICKKFSIAKVGMSALNRLEFPE